MTYKEALIESMTMLAMDDQFRAIGYGLLNQKGANGTLKMLPNEKVVECSVCEGLMGGMAQGMAMCGYKPLMFLERCDFALLALDSIVNHLDKCEEISRGEFVPCVIIRIVAGNRNRPLFTGPTHTQDFSDAFRLMLKMPVFSLKEPEEVLSAYKLAKLRQDHKLGSTMLVEYKDLL